MRCSPSADNPVLADFDKLLRRAISHLTSCDLSDEEWLQAIKMGGLEVRKVSSLALSAYLASAASSASLQNTIFDSVRPPEDEVLGVYLSEWQSIPGAVLPWTLLQPSSPSGIIPASLRPDSKCREESKSDASQNSKAQFLSASAPHNGDWLLALHVASCGLKLDDEHFVWA